MEIQAQVAAFPLYDSIFLFNRATNKRIIQNWVSGRCYLNNKVSPLYDENQGAVFAANNNIQALKWKKFGKFW